MDDKDTKKSTAGAEQTDTQIQDELENSEWGENNQERIVDRSPRRKSARHVCKGPACIKSFEKS